MKYLLDTNTCIRFLNGRSEQIKMRIEGLTPDEILLCSIVKAELFYGALKSQYPEKNLARQLQFVNRFLSLSFNDTAADAYSHIRTQLEKKGTPIGPNDLIIASIAVANKLILVSHNTKEFSRIPDLMLEDWEL
ncbi:MAG: type II toxin-antitoxin system VapC family toxin [SAR324 cluster bacterium]|nr:type II toxin-antitoxin system VapC family toxin [SAR324 cluster bacterium]